MKGHSGVVLVVFFWIVSLLGNFLEIANIIRASSYTYVIVFLFIVSFLVGYISLSVTFKSYTTDFSPIYVINYNKILLLSFSLIVFVLFCLYMSGGLSMSPYDYFLSQRGPHVEHKTGTGIRSIENVMQLIVQPAIISLTMLMCYFFVRAKMISKFFTSSVIIVALLYSYFYQANTTVVFLFFAIVSTFILVFFVRADYLLQRKKLIFTLLFLIFFIVFFIAANRFGRFDLYGVLIYYPATYFTISFSFFDHYFTQPNSILFEHTYGESILGYISLIFSLFLRTLGDDFVYTSATVENVFNNSIFINLGLSDDKYVNAFGSILFSSFRDFGVFGVLLVGYFFGFFLFLSKLRYKEPFFGTLHIYLLVILIMAFTVSPFDLPFFWNTIICIFVFSKLFKFSRVE